MAKTNPKKKTSNLTKYNRAGYFFVHQIEMKATAF